MISMTAVTHRRSLLLWAPIAISVALAAKGVAQLLFVPNAGYDIRLLWTATQYFLRGANPFDASFYANDLAQGLHPAAVPTYFPDLGWPEQVNYPPTSTLTQLLLFSLPLPATYALYIVISIAGLCVVAWWASRQIDDAAVVRWSVAGIALANLGYSQTIINGNYGIVAMAALCGAIALRSRAPVAAGVLLGMALVKPTLTAPFLLLFLADGCFLILGLCAAYLGLSTIVTIWLTGASLQTLLHASLEGSSRFATGGYGLWQMLRAGGFSQPVALAVNAAIFLLPLAFLVWGRPRRESSLSMAYLAAAGVAARLFTYHNSIDNVIVSFLAIALAQRAMLTRASVDIAWVVLVMFTLLTPFVVVNSVAGHLALYVIWVAATAYVCMRPMAARGDVLAAH